MAENVKSSKTLVAATFEMLRSSIGSMWEIRYCIWSLRGIALR